MESIVLELQKEVVENKLKLSDLLRKGLLIAKKLQLKEFEEWIMNELEGYPNCVAGNLPSYRSVPGLLYARNPYVGSQHVSIENREVEDLLTKKSVFQSVAEIENILQTMEKGKYLQLEFSGNHLSMIQKLFKTNDYQFYLRVEYYQYQGIIDTVKTKMLSWAIELEKNGILGDGVMFSKEEKEIADKNIHITINTSGEGSNVQVLTDSPHAMQTMQIKQGNFKEIQKKVQELLGVVNDLKLDINEQKDLESDLKMMLSQTEKTKPQMTILKAVWGSAKTIVEGATGNVVAAGIVAEITKLLS